MYEKTFETSTHKLSGYTLEPQYCIDNYRENDLSFILFSTESLIFFARSSFVNKYFSQSFVEVNSIQEYQLNYR